VLTELDYHSEAYNGRRLAATVQDVSGVDTPRIYSGLSSTRVLTMDFVDGVTIVDVAAIRAAGIDPVRLSERFLEGAVKQLLVDGFFHGDPHPGNVLVDLSTGDVRMIDLGMCGQLTFQQRFTLIQLLVVARRQDVTGMAQVMRDLSTPFRAVDDTDYRRDFERRVGRFLDPDSDAPLGDAMTVGFRVLRDNGLRLDPSFTLAVKAMVQAEVIATTLWPQGGILTSGYEIAERLLRQRLTGEQLGGAGARGAEALLLDLVRQAPRRYGQAGHVEPGGFPAAGDAPGRVSASAGGADPAFAGPHAVAAVTLAGVLVGSAVVLASDAVPTGWLWVRDVSAVCFVAALAAALLLLVGVARRIRGPSR
jgi:predicted unusual protein kinase regulating ubiquinone biosynthesis (AarF/ABC1/UbiB family)